MSKKLIFLENKFQAKEYLKNKSKYKNYLPISFSFEVEKILSEKKAFFKRDEDYEVGIYPNNLSSEAMTDTWKIIKKSNLKYRGIPVLDLFYYELYLILANSKKYSLLFKKIIEIENPKEIVIFNSNSSLEKENIFLLAKENYEERIRVISYKGIPYHKVLVLVILSFASIIQKTITLLRMNVFKKKNNIFTSSGKRYFREIINGLAKNKKNRIIDFSDKLRKSFFIGNTYAAFYEFFGRESHHQKNFQKNFLEFKKEFKFPKDFEKGRERYIKEKLLSLLNTKSKKVLSNLEEMDFLFKKRKIKAVMLAEDGCPFSRGIIFLANKFGIKSYIFQHGLMVCGIELFTSPSAYFVFGDVSKKAIEKNCSEKTKVISIGCPRYNEFEWNSAKKDKKEIVYAMEITSERVMLPDTHLTRKRQKELLKKLFKVMKKIPDYKLILKIRPKWELKEMLHLIAKSEKFENYEIIEKTNNTKLLSEAAVVIVNNSTMGIEACLLGNPPISLSYPNLDKSNPYKKFNGVNVVYTEKELELEIKDKIKNPKVLSKKDLKDQIIFDGKTNERILDVIKKELGKN